MFTGLIDDVGVVERAAETGAGRELRIVCHYDDLVPGESVAVNGVCLTVREAGAGWFTVAAVDTTRGRTAVSDWSSGTRVNLERALRVGARLGGHIVQGHVDGIAQVTGVRRSDDATLLDLAVPEGLAELMVPHGSITVDGVSLTVNDLPSPGVVQLSLVEYTLRHTTLGALAVGDVVHVEGDVIGKYVRRLLAPWSAAPSHDA